MNSPEPSQDPQDLEDLERRLAALQPSPPRSGAARRIGRHLDGLSANRSQNRRLWWRMASVGAAACLVFAGGSYLEGRLSGIASQKAGPTTLVETAAPMKAPTAMGSNGESSGTFISPPPIQTGIPSDHFRPVSSQDYLRDATQGGVVELFDRQPAREIRVEYDSAWHWQDPDTQTNVRVYRPREEIILVPIETD